MSVTDEAKRLHERVSDEIQRSTSADDLLLFLYRLRDEMLVVRSSSPLIQGRSFHTLNDLIYNLEARPDETLTNPDRLQFVLTLLNDLGNGTIVTKAK